MKFIENQTIIKSKQETLSNNFKIKANINLYIILVIGAMFLGDIIVEIFQYYIFGKDIIETSDMYNIFSLIGQIVPIAISLLVAKKFLNRSDFSLGLRKENFAKDYLQGISISLFQLLFIILLAFILNSVSISINQNIRIPIILIFTLGWIIQGFFEELVCRSIFMNGFTGFMSVKSAIILNSLIFSLLHIGNENVNLISLINLFLIGIIYSLLFYLKDSIWISAAAHSFWNMIQGNIFGVSVSGFRIFNSTILKTEFRGANIITGGFFGIEASILCTISEIVLIGIVYYFLKRKGLIVK